MESHIYGRCFYLVWGTEVEPENTRGSEKRYLRCREYGKHVSGKAADFLKTVEI